MGCEGGFGSYANRLDDQDNCDAVRWPIANTSHIDWYSIEDNQAHEDFWRPLWLIVLPNEYGTTALNTSEASSRASAYVYWYMTPLVQFSEAECVAPSSWPVRCSQSRVRFRQGAYPNATVQARAQAVCHEVGHTVGFGEYAFAHIGCMGGGTSNGGQIHSREVASINYCYAFGSC